MPEEIEVPTEHLHETIHEHAEHSGDRWTLLVALTTAFLAVLAAITALLAGHHSNEAMIDQMQASDQWAYYQAKGIKSSILQSKMELLASLGKESSGGDKEKIAEYKKEQKEIEDVAREKGQSSEKHLLTHVTLARAVTVFQVAIALGAIAVVTKRKPLWYVSLVLGVGGVAFLAWGLM